MQYITPLSDAHVKALGELVVAVTNLHNVVIDLLRIFMNTEIVAAVIAFSHQQTSSNVDTLKALYSLGMSKEERQSDTTLWFFQQVREIADYRNTVVHAYWQVDINEQAWATRFQARGEFKRTKKPISDKEIQDKTVEARELYAMLCGLRDHLNQTPPPSREEAAQKRTES